MKNGERLTLVISLKNGTDRIVYFVEQFGKRRIGTEHDDYLSV